MRNDKIFRKRSVLRGCYSAQPGSRLMTPSSREGEQPHKIWISGVGGGVCGAARGGRAGRQPQNLVPSPGLARQSSQRRLLGPGGRKPQRGVLTLPSQLEGIGPVLWWEYWVERQEAWPFLEPAVWPSTSHLTSLSLCFLHYTRKAT